VVLRAVVGQDNKALGSSSEDLDASDKEGF